MAYLKIMGARPLTGECRVQGAKNSALPILASTVLVKGQCVLHNCPALSDVAATVSILEHLGCRVKTEEHTVITDGSCVSENGIPYPLMREMRSSVIFLGAILARQGSVRLSAPGGCEIGLRPIDLHLSAMHKLGALVERRAGEICCTAPGGLRGAPITLSFPSVGATENIMIAASTAKGLTVVSNAAREPEIGDLADFLNACGARIRGAGDGTIFIEGVKELHPAEHTVIPDRIAAATYLCAAAMTKGDIALRDVIPAHLASAVNVFEEAGCTVICGKNSVRLKAPARLHAVRMIRTMPYPGFPTDIQAPVTAMLSVANGTSVMIETIFESRYKYIGELTRFGAKISVDGRMAVTEGVETLTGASVIAPDLRGGAALVLAGLAAHGETEVSGLKHIDRGYEKLELTLSGLSADIKRTDEDEQRADVYEKSFASAGRDSTAADEP